MEIKKYKYPKTLHLPFSDGIQNDDKVLNNTKCFENKIIVILEKMDGENTTIYTDHIHARSIDSGNHVSRDWVKAFAATFQNKIPLGFRICGENLYAKHSIFYKNLQSYFLGFSVWDNNNNCLEYWKTNGMFSRLGIAPVNELWMGKFEDFMQEINNGKNIKQFLSKIKTQNEEIEGFVIRNRDSFHFNDFNKNVAKYVRVNHVQTNKHWMNQQIIKNKII